MSATTTHSALRLHHLTFVSEAEGVMVGRPDTGSYALFPAEGAELLKQLQAGSSLATAAQRLLERSGQVLDAEDFLTTLDELGFVVGELDVPAGPPVVRWQRLASALFSVPAWLAYGVLTAAAVLSMVHDPTLRPSYHNLFFTSHISVIPVLLALAQFPCLVLHEGFHSLAGRRLGLPSTFGVGRRFYFVVAETRLDALYSVPRRKRYLPFLAGIVADVVLISSLTLLCALGRRWGAPTWLHELALALAFTCVMRLLWQGLFYLETDLYFVVATASRCTDLQNAARARVKTWLRAHLGRPPEPASLDWSAHDLAVARWYAPLLVAGYGVSLAGLLLVGLPTSLRFWTTVLHRLDGSQPRTLGLLIDTCLFIALSATQFGLLIHVTVRDLRRRRRDRARRLSKGLT